MNANVLRAGWSRGLIELRQSFTNGPELVSHLLWPALMVATLFFIRDLPAGPVLLGALALPGILGTNAATGLIGMSQRLTADREDGTLLRAKATPHGMPAYLIGKVISVSGGLLADLVIFLVPAAFLVEGLRIGAVLGIGQSWRHLETAGVLGAWAVLGLLLAPAGLRRMARGESGSAVAARRERALQRVG